MYSYQIIESLVSKCINPNRNSNRDEIIVSNNYTADDEIF